MTFWPHLSCGKSCGKSFPRVLTNFTVLLKDISGYTRNHNLFLKWILVKYFHYSRSEFKYYFSVRRNLRPFRLPDDCFTPEEAFLIPFTNPPFRAPWTPERKALLSSNNQLVILNGKFLGNRDQSWSANDQVPIGIKFGRFYQFPRIIF